MLQNHLQWYPESWTAALLSFTLLTRCSFETACLVIASAECQPYGHGHLFFTWIRSMSRILLLVWCFYSWMQFEGIVCGPAWCCGSIFLVGVFLKQKKKIGSSLDTTSVHLGLPVLAVWLSLCIVGQEEEPLQLGAADIVLMSWSRNGSY